MSEGPRGPSFPPTVWHVVPRGTVLCPPGIGRLDRPDLGSEDPRVHLLTPSPASCGRRQFVVNIVSEWMVESCNCTCASYDAGVNEFEVRVRVKVKVMALPGGGTSRRRPCRRFPSSTRCLG